MAVFNNILAGAAGSGGAAGYEITRSLRFNSADSAYLNRTPASAGNRKTWTWSGWVKQSALTTSAGKCLFSVGTSTSSMTRIVFVNASATAQIYVDDTSLGATVSTSSTYRDLSAWMHILVSFDTTQSTTSNRIKIYVNGSQVTTLASQTYPSLNADGLVNGASTHSIGREQARAASYFDGYLADVHFIDGQALAPTDFGEYDDNNVWQPKTVSVSSINDGTVWSNGWDSTNINSSFPGTNSFDGSLTTKTLPNNNTTATWTPSSGIAIGTSLRIYGRRETSGGTLNFNFSDSTTSTITISTTTTWYEVSGAAGKTLTSVVIGKDSSGNEGVFHALEIDGEILIDSYNNSTGYGTNGFHLDFSDNSSASALGTDSSGNDNTWTVNNLVGTGGTFQTGHTTQSYTGNGTSQSRTGVGFSPDLVWIKSRTSGQEPMWFDTKRGATNYLQSTNNGVELSNSNTLTSFDSDGFSVGSLANVNENTQTLAAWMWDAGSGSYGNNTDGTITTSTKQNGKFAVTFWDTGAAQVNIGTGLSSVDFCILKAVDGTNDWNVWHKSFADTNNTSTRLRLNTANIAEQNSDYFAGGGAVGNGKIALGSLGNPNNEMIAYSWKEVAGESKFNYYQGNGTFSGATQTITTGFKPALVLIKSTSVGERWVVFDSVATGKYLYTSEASSQISTSKLEILDTGFKVTGSDAEWNDPNHFYIYAAWSGAQVKQTDSLIDTPTNYEASSGNNGGNYATLNPLDTVSLTLSNGNLDVTNFGTSRQSHTTILPSSGKWYAEFTCNAAMSDVQIGVANNDGTSYLGSNTDSWGVISINGSSIHNNSQSSYGSSFTTGDTVMVALDLDNGKWYAGKNGTWFNSGDPANGTNPAHTGLSGNIGFAVGSNNTGGDISCNFGQRPFAYTPPTGFLSLCTTNLPDPTIADGSTAMDVATWTGNNGTQTISLPGGFNPDLVWVKNRSGTTWHTLVDSVRGTPKELYSNATNAEATSPTASNINNFQNGSFDVGPGSSDASAVNATGSSYVGWAWDAGSSTVSNTDGSITSTVRANASAGFSIVSYTGNSTAGSTLGHSLSAAPKMIIVKNRSRTTYGDWVIGHDAINGFQDGNQLYFTTAAVASSEGFFNNTSPTSSVFTVKNNYQVNYAGEDYIAYCFAPVEGYSAFGSYNGNGSADGPFVFTGHASRWIMIKRTDSTGSWIIYDTQRNLYNTMDLQLLANEANAETTTTTGVVDTVSNGFKLRGTGSNTNASGGTYIYAAFAEHPLALNGGLAR